MKTRVSPLIWHSRPHTALRQLWLWVFIATVGVASASPWLRPSQWVSVCTAKGNAWVWVDASVTDGAPLSHAALDCPACLGMGGLPEVSPLQTAAARHAAPFQANSPAPAPIAPLLAVARGPPVT